jgi:poly-gamma-glutamate capsule biosynthesis protein CapA/YwtB (metallophosphatase superfamily)
MLHWSIEFETYPIENIITMGHRIMDSGVDIILGGHPHVAQPMEKYSFYDPIEKINKDGFIIYSLGELVSLNLFSKNSRLASLVKLEISQGIENGLRVVRITDLKALPIYTLYTKNANGERDYRILDFLKTLRELESGRNPYKFSKKEIKELKRLEQLLYSKILPQNTLGILD